jgi:uncharacterized protein YdhG (YjbR/CyaY superfamily)
MKSKPSTIDDYFQRLSKDQRVALQKLRNTIHLAAPRAEECISYAIPAFRLDGLLVGFGAAKNHCSFYPMSSALVAKHEAELRDYNTSKGTVRFTPDKPLPAALVRKFVKARIAENKARVAARNR